MSKMKRMMSLFMAFIMVLALAPITSAENVFAAEQKGTTALFNGHATYLLQERFTSQSSLEDSTGLYNRILSGWDTDYRGGRMTRVDGRLTLIDESGFDKISLNHKLMSHSGESLTFEAGFEYDLLVSDGFYYEIGGEGKTALRLEVKNGYLCVAEADGTYTQLEKCVVDTAYGLKVNFSNRQDEVTIWVNGVEKGTFDYKESTNVIDEVELGTTKEQVARIHLDYVYVYVNYLVNETFMSAPLGTTTEWLNGRDGAKRESPGAPYANDIN